MGGEALTMALACPHSPLGIGGEPRPNASKVEGLVHLRRDGGRRTMVRMCPHSPLGIEGEHRPNVSKVECLVHFR